MPRKIKELVKDYIDAGFELVRGAKGSHRKFRHPFGVTAIVSGKDSSDAKHYQEKDLINKINETKKRGKYEIVR